jgi:hypothetical protein
MAMTVVLLSHSLLREGNKDNGVAEGWGYLFFLLHFWPSVHNTTHSNKTPNQAWFKQQLITSFVLAGTSNGNIQRVGNLNS